MATTCKLIAKTTLGSNAATIEFTSIPSTFTDLLVVASLRSTYNDVTSALVLRLSGVTTGYSSREIQSNGSTVGSSARSTFDSGVYAGNMCGATTTSNTFSSLEVYIPNYTGSANKSFSVTHAMESNAATGPTITALAGLLTDTNAVSAVRIYAWGSNPGDFATGCSVSLFGISKA
jgi:hypothetical protein